MINGSSLSGDLINGPVLCEKQNMNQCYQPSPSNSLAVHLQQQVQRYIIHSSSGFNGSISPNGDQSVNLGSSIVYTATPNIGYGVSQWFVDNNLVQTGGNTYQFNNVIANHTINVLFTTTTLTPSVSTLGLSVNCPLSSLSSDCIQKNDALTGHARKITITNTGSINATNVQVGNTNLPRGTQISLNNCSTITANGGFCTITVTPGSVESRSFNNVPCSSGITPQGQINITADGDIMTTIDTSILTYGCIYQGGLIYAVDDTTADTGSIGGKVITLVDQAAPFINNQPQPSSVIWSSNGVGQQSQNVSYDIVPYIAYSGALDTYNLALARFNTTYVNSAQNPFPPVNAFSMCVGARDGQCNSRNILTFYSQYNTRFGIDNTLVAMSTPLNYYAAGLCTASINTYSDWYLPAICELDSTFNNLCDTNPQSVGQNLGALRSDQANTCVALSNNPDLNCLTGAYWSSSEESGNPTEGASFVTFSANGVNSGNNYKASALGVRCSRTLVP